MLLEYITNLFTHSYPASFIAIDEFLIKHLDAAVKSLAQPSDDGQERRFAGTGRTSQQKTGVFEIKTGKQKNGWGGWAFFFLCLPNPPAIKHIERMHAKTVNTFPRFIGMGMNICDSAR